MPTTKRTKLLVLGGLAIGMSLGSAGTARADLRVCNDTDVLAGVAIGYRVATGWVTEGWWNIEGGSCQTLIEGNLQSRYYYLYAEDAQRGGRWTGKINMCVASEPFKIVGFEDCFARGFQRAAFQEHDTANQSSWMIQLTDPKQTPPATGASGNSNPAVVTPAPATPAPATPAP
jgi:uncharacterized membrane protein